MDTYLNFKPEKVKLGFTSANSIKDDVLRGIAESINNEKGGALIYFEKLTDSVFEQLTQCFQNPVAYGNESYIVKLEDDIYERSHCCKQF